MEAFAPISCLPPCPDLAKLGGVSLRSQLQKILPGILPVDEAGAMKGTELIERVRAVLGDKYSERSYRSQFSMMALDPGSCLARVEKGQGYYLKDPGRLREENSLQGLFDSEEKANRAGHDPYRKLLAAVARMQDAAGRGAFVYPAEESASWGHPDIVAVSWPPGYWEDGAWIFLREAAGGIPSASLKSVCVGIAASTTDNRGEFFRALASGLWAQEIELVLVGDGLDAEAENELAQLAALYGVGVVHLPMTDKALAQLPRADEIFRAPLEQWRSLADQMTLHVIATPRYRAEAASQAAPLDQSDIEIVRAWVDGCLERGRVEACEFRVSVS